MDWTGLVEGAAVLLAGWAAWLSIPRAPALDWERLFKVTISVSVWAELEAAGTPDASEAPQSVDSFAEPMSVEARWRAVLATAVPYHPAGRGWRAKLVDPGAYAVPIPALPGERALLEALLPLETVAERWSRMFGSRAHAVDPAVAEALGDPRDLGDAYDPRRLFGPEAGWAEVAAWSDAVVAGLTRRLSHVVLLELGLPAGLSPGAELPNVRRHALPGVDARPAADWVDLCEAASDRLVVVLRSELLHPWLTAMAGSPALVDRVVCVIAVGGTPATDEAARESLETLLRSEALLPELQRQTPVAVIDDVDPADPMDSGMPPIELPALEPGRLGVRWVDLGPLAVTAVPPRCLSRALGVSIGFLLDA